MPVSLPRVKRELKQFGRNPTKYPKPKIMKVTTSAALGVKTLTFRAVVKSQGKEMTKPGPNPKGTKKVTNYLVTVQFFNVQFEQKKKDKTWKPIRIDGRLWYYKPPSVRTNLTKLKCPCDDFRWKWEFSLHDEKGLIGNFRKYNRKTPPPPMGYPYANPDEFMGYCKHINNLLLVLKQRGYIRG